MAGTGTVVLYRIYGVLFVVLILFSAHTLLAFHKVHKLCSWAAYVVFMEGIAAGVFRAFRTLTGPYPFNGNSPLDFHSWINETSDTPIACATTLVTAFVWAKLVVGR